MLEKLKSRKLIVAVLTSVGVAVNNAIGMPIDEQTVYCIVGIITAYLVGQGIADNAKKEA